MITDLKTLITVWQGLSFEKKILLLALFLNFYTENEFDLVVLNAIRKLFDDNINQLSTYLYHFQTNDCINDLITIVDSLEKINNQLGLPYSAANILYQLQQLKTRRIFEKLHASKLIKFYSDSNTNIDVFKHYILQFIDEYFDYLKSRLNVDNQNNIIFYDIAGNRVTKVNHYFGIVTENKYFIGNSLIQIRVFDLSGAIGWVIFSPEKVFVLNNLYNEISYQDIYKDTIVIDGKSYKLEYLTTDFQYIYFKDEIRIKQFPNIAEENLKVAFVKDRVTNTYYQYDEIFLEEENLFDFLYTNLQNLITTDICDIDLFERLFPNPSKFAVEIVKPFMQQKLKQLVLRLTKISIGNKNVYIPITIENYSDIYYKRLITSLNEIGCIPIEDRLYIKSKDTDFDTFAKQFLDTYASIFIFDI